MSFRMGMPALRQSLDTLAAVSSPDSVVRSMQVTARHSQAACHCFLTVRRVPKVAALVLRRDEMKVFVDIQEVGMGEGDHHNVCRCVHGG